MSLYRFSPIKTKAKLIETIRYIHFASYDLCKNSFGVSLPNSGNVGVFSHYELEFEYLDSLRQRLTSASNNFDQKYFRLRQPIVFPAKGSIPKTSYEYLYIRKPDPYRHHVGDVDFYLDEGAYKNLKKDIQEGRAKSGMRIFPAPYLDMIELFDPDSDVLAYVSTKKMTDLVKKTKSGT